MRKPISPGLATAFICGALSLSTLNVAAAAPKFIYTVSTDQIVRSFSVNTTTGALLSLPGGTRIVDEFPFGMAANPEGTLLYSVNPNSNDIAAFKADPNTGSLTQALSCPYVMPPDSAGAVLQLAC